MVLRNGGSYKGYWALPGGMMDRNETPEKAVLREFFEETGMEAESPTLLTAYLIKCDDAELPHTSVDIVYSLKTKTNQIPKPDIDEVSRVAFFPINELPKKIAFGHREIISRYPNGHH